MNERMRKHEKETREREENREGGREFALDERQKNEKCEKSYSYNLIFERDFVFAGLA